MADERPGFFVTCDTSGLPGHCKRGTTVSTNPNLDCTELSYVVRFTVLAAGTIADYTDEVIAKYDNVMATITGVPVELLHTTVELARRRRRASTGERQPAGAHEDSVRVAVGAQRQLQTPASDQMVQLVTSIDKTAEGNDVVSQEEAQAIQQTMADLIEDTRAQLTQQQASGLAPLHLPSLLPLFSFR